MITMKPMKPERLKTEKLTTGTFASLGKAADSPKPLKLKSPAKELTDEIKKIRQRNREFAATNSHETYLIVTFSTKEDKNEFARAAKLAVVQGLTIVDGYKLASNLGITPVKPRFKLHPPLSSKRVHR